MTRKALNTTPYSIELNVDSKVEHLPIIIRKHPASRHIVLRYQPLQHAISLTLPRYVSIKQGLHFIEKKRAWLAQQVKENPGNVPFKDGQQIPVLGKIHTLHHVGGRGIVRIEETRILVPGEAQFMARRVREWLKNLARDEIATVAREKAEQIDKTVRKISVRDTSSRWGSCSHDGNLSFSWRLVLAPYAVLNYVTCHEVAHLVELNHSDKFWKIVETLCPDYKTHYHWLSQHGATLYAYG